MVDRFGGRLVVAGICWTGQGGDVENVGCCATVGSDAGFIFFIELVVKEEEGHVRGGGEPALVRVGGSGVGGSGDLDWRFLIGDVDDCKL